MKNVLKGVGDELFRIWCNDIEFIERNINIGDEPVLLKFPPTHNGKLREWQAAEILIRNGSARIKAL